MDDDEVLAGGVEFRHVGERAGRIDGAGAADLDDDGPGGEHVERLEGRLGCDVEIVEGADTAEAFVANALAPAAVYNVTISGEDDEKTVAYAEVDSDDRGVAIGTDGRNIEVARRLAERHFDVDEIALP